MKISDFIFACGIVSAAGCSQSPDSQSKALQNQIIAYVNNSLTGKIHLPTGSTCSLIIDHTEIGVLCLKGEEPLPPIIITSETDMNGFSVSGVTDDGKGSLNPDTGKLVYPNSQEKEGSHTCKPIKSKGIEI